ncbi:hypothetical protein [Tenacibaculum maritimum]|uniref:Uncharacterized protein n=1 Tax=Tenacibaculum maritimum NCIMB 2154 TaxID=1349785 RepID=A0A2H1E7D2_9FLAO|nr:hypothetical protein [Tenacibaculum maritimum]SFZ80261.1 conserved protein of unknown function [Tenacibaculum maritimum NCIMB 2154]
MKQKEHPHIFNFVEEISKPETYKQLYPDEKEGIVIAHLYQRVKSGRYKNDSFTAKDIHSLFEETMNEEEKRVSDVKGRINKLQKYFLKYNEETQLYSFQEYGIKFCRIAEETLIGSLKPTEIKIICSQLKQQLRESIGDEKKIKEWFTIHFKNFHPNLKQQIDFLDRQIDEAVEKLRNDTLSEKQTPLKLLQTVSNDLFDIQKKNDELRSAFSETYSISTLLYEIETEQKELLEHMKHTHRFFNNAQSSLRNTNKRLDRIQPKIRQLFFTLGQPEYSAKIDRFILFLLKYSSLEKKGKDKEIVFPKEINTKTTNYKRPKYLLLDRDRNLFPTQAKPRKKYIRNPKVEKLSKAILQKAFDDTEIIENWVNFFFQELQKRKVLNISQGFFSVLKETNDFTIATKVTFRVIEDAHNNEKYKVDIDKTDFVKNKNTALWKTMIFQK